MFLDGDDFDCLIIGLLLIRSSKLTLFNCSIILV